VNETAANEKIHKALADSPETVNHIGTFFYEHTLELIKSNSYSLVGKKSYGVDIVRDVLKIVPIIWAASGIVISSPSTSLLSAIADSLVQAGIPLKTKDHPHGHYTPAELYDILGDIYSFVTPEFSLPFLISLCLFFFHSQIHLPGR